MNKPGKINLRNLTRQECEALVQKLGWPAFRGRQIFHWVQNKGLTEISGMKNLSLEQREMLAEGAEISQPKLLLRQDAAAGDTHKCLLELKDGEKIEMALMLYDAPQSRSRATCCVSTQSGCPMGCTFCASGRYKKGRNLTAGEILSQIWQGEAIAKERGFEGISNVVYMGMGEPLLNLKAVHKSLLILNDEEGLNIGMRRMTISTCGLVPQIYEMAKWGLQVGLAVSLHGADNEIRSALMPVNQKYPLEELLPACRAYFEASGQRITYEYALFAGINDGEENAHRLGKLLKGQNCLVNIIPGNPVAETGFTPPRGEEIKKFTAIISSYGLSVQQRASRGQDIDAACGQLRHR